MDVIFAFSAVKIKIEENSYRKFISLTRTMEPWQNSEVVSEQLPSLRPITSSKRCLFECPVSPSLAVLLLRLMILLLFLEQIL